MLEELDTSLRPMLSSDYVIYKNEDDLGVYLFNINDGSVFEINSTTYDFINLCTGELTIGQIFNELCKIYGIDYDVLIDDFKELVVKWIELKILSQTIKEK